MLMVVRHVDIRKPWHAAVAGVIVAAFLVPGAYAWMTNQRYKISDVANVITKPSPTFKDKLAYINAEHRSVFNQQGEQDVTAEAKDKLTAKVGSSDKLSTQLYTASLPDKASDGIVVHDNVNKVSVNFHPLFETLPGRKDDGHVVYPLKGQSGAMVYTPKANGLKEDIVLKSAPGDSAEYSYRLELPDTLAAKILPSGDVGFYSGDPQLFGNITFASDSDRDMVEKARKNAEKTYLMFKIPAPVITQARRPGAAGPTASFQLSGNTLTVVVRGLAKASYPLSIDPTFLITSASDFNLGRAEDNIDFSVAGQIGRAPITGGALDTNGWQPTSAITACTINATNFNFGMTAYNGFLYMVGGGNGASTTVCYAAINSNGSLGTWINNTNQFTVGRTGAAVTGFNGYIYVMGGENSNGNTQFATVEYSKVQADGSLGIWATTTPMLVTRSYFGLQVYQGYIYAIGGQNARRNGSLLASTEYVKINATGTLGTWTNTASFTTARDRQGTAAYNGYVYLFGGLDGAANVLSDVQYAPINSDGTLGAWVTTRAMPGVRRSFSYAVERGHLYAYGGCTTAQSCTGYINSTIYAAINADGSIGPWDSTSTFTTARSFSGGASYNGFLYLSGGCTLEPPVSGNNCNAELGDSFYGTIDVPGGVGTPATSANSITATRAGAATLAYNGFIYAAGGCSGISCATYSAVTEWASINDDGTMSAWTAGTALPAATGMNAGRYGGTLIASGGKMFYVGGIEKTTGAVDSYANTLFSTSPSNSIPTWTQETAAFSNGRYFHTTALWKNFIYVFGGRDGATSYNDVQNIQVVNGTLTAPANCVADGGILSGSWCKSGNTFTTGRSGHAGLAYNGNLYVIAGENNAGALLSDSQRAAIATDGYVGSFTADASLPAPATDAAIGHRYVSASAHNSTLYLYGGLNNGATASNVIMWAPLTGATGTVGSWVKSLQTLSTARWGAAATPYNGYIYVVGGCTTGVPPCTAYLSSVEIIRANNGSTGQTSQTNAGIWTNAANSFSTARADLQYVAFNGFMYVMGGCTAYTTGTCSAWTTNVQHAAIASSGNLGAWSGALDAQLTVGRSYGAALVYNSQIYLIGGSVPGTVDTGTVLSATINATGNVGSWSTLSSLPSGAERRGFGAAVSNNYIYIAGGVNSSTRKNDVLYSKIATDGTLSSPANCVSSGGTLSAPWCTSGKTFTTARQDLNVVTYNSVLYVATGYDGTNNLGDVQYSSLNVADGSLGNFIPTTSQDRNGRSRGMVGANGYMYFLGSEVSNTVVYYTDINANNTLGNLYQASSTGMLSTAGRERAHGGILFSKGFIYALGGCVVSAGSCTTVNATTDFTGQKATPRLAHYSKLFDTQIDTTPSQMSINGALGSGGSSIITSVRTASTSDPVLGIAQIFNPTILGNSYNVQALNSSGINVGVAFNYLIQFTLDDSQSGAFPDVNISGSSTAIADFTLYYHANPGRRLRHGASYTNTGCNPAVSVSDGCILDTAP